jgi:lauroyl/myristoyl acyltransferase
MAKVADAPLIPIWIRFPVDKLPGRCVIGPPLYVQGDVRTAVEAQAALMEAEVREDPACWTAWLNPRRGASLGLG